jgi:predicted transcriptional regulator
MSRSATLRERKIGTPGREPAGEDIVVKIGELLHELVRRPSPRPSIVRMATWSFETRRRRRSVFGGREVSDNAWDILLDLFIASFESRKVTVKRACVAADAPMTTAIRYIAFLESIGLVVRSKNPNDARSTFLELTDLGIGKLTRYFNETMKAVESLYE